MKKKVFLFLIILLFAAFPIFSQFEDNPINIFDNTLGAAGLICEATGFGLVIGGGMTTSLDLEAAFIMMQIAPLFSTGGAWFTQTYMLETSAEWKERGLVFDASGYIDESESAAIGTTAFAAGALLAPLIPDAGIYISLACTAAAVIWDMIALYGPRQEWYMAINEAIKASDINWQPVNN